MVKQSDVNMIPSVYDAGFLTGSMDELNAENISLGESGIKLFEPRVKCF
jgi:hypothetical protein